MRFDDVERQWQAWRGGVRGGRDLRRWSRRAEALTGWAPDELDHPSWSPETDAMQAALVLLAQQGESMAAVILLHQLRPGLRRVARSARRWAAIEGVDPEAETLSAACEVLVAHRLDRRPSRIAANICGDTRQRLWRSSGRVERSDAAARTLAVALEPGGPPDPATTTDTLDLLADIRAALANVHRCPRSRAVTAELAYRTWILDQAPATVADDLGLARVTVSSRLCRLRASLRAGVAGSRS